MKVHIVRAAADRSFADLLDQNSWLRHTMFVNPPGRLAVCRPGGDALDTADATHLLLTDGDELVGGSRLTPLDKPNLLQTAFSGLVQEDLPASPSLGADWTRFYVRPDRREGWRRVPESAALFCAMMEYALFAGYFYLTLVSPIAMLEHGTSLGWRMTPLGAPALIAGRPAIAAWIEVSERALGDVRQVTGRSTPLLAKAAERRRAPSGLRLLH